MMDLKAKSKEVTVQIYRSGELMELGALRGSAHCLRRAADIVDELADYQNKLLEEACGSEGAGK